MTLNLTVSQQAHTDFTPRITIIGVGGGGTNAVDNMIALNLQGVEFVVANTDAQQLLHSRAARRIQLGPHITQGLGAGAKPDVGRMAAEEAADELDRHLDGAHMVFITAGMGGGTGTGAAPVIAKMARERGILTVGVVTKPFTFEGLRRARAAEAGIEQLQEFVDTLIVIPNQNLFRLANDRTGWKEAFKMADNVLYMGVRGVTDLMMAPGLVNLDFADIRTVMLEMGKAMMGTGEADGEGRAVRAAEAAINNPLLEDTSMAGAKGLLINITGGDDMTLFEVDEAANRIRQEVDEEANIIFGSILDESLTGKIRVSVVATGIDTQPGRIAERPRLVAVGGGGGGAQVQAISSQQAPAPSDTVQRAGSMGGQAATGQPGMRPSAPPMPGNPMPLRPAQPGGRAPMQPQPQQQVQPQAYSLQQPPPRTNGATAYNLQPMEAEAPAPSYEAVSYAEPNRQQAAPAPMRPQPAPPAQPPRTSRYAGDTRIPGRDNGLFTQPSAEPPPPPPNRSLFSRVTGAIRGNHHHEAAAPQPQSAPPSGHEYDYEEPRGDGGRTAMRQPGREDVQPPIPTFLLKQTNPSRS